MPENAYGKPKRLQDMVPPAKEAESEPKRGLQSLAMPEAKQPGFIERVKARWNDPYKNQHFTEQFYFPFEDNICDYVPNSHPNFEEWLREAKERDKEGKGVLVNAIMKEINKRNLILNGFKRQPPDNCEGLRTYPLRVKEAENKR